MTHAVSRTRAGTAAAVRDYAFFLLLIAGYCALFMAAHVYGSGGMVASQAWFVVYVGLFTAGAAIAVLVLAAAMARPVIEAPVPASESELAARLYSPRPETAAEPATQPFTVVALPEPPPASSLTPALPAPDPIPPTLVDANPEPAPEPIWRP